jgi:hypothetical protein
MSFIASVCAAVCVVVTRPPVFALTDVTKAVPAAWWRSALPMVSVAEVAES